MIILNSNLQNFRSKFALSNITQFTIVAYAEYFDLLFRINATHLYMFRIFTNSAHLAMYETNNNGQSYTTLWDKILP